MGIGGTKDRSEILEALLVRLFDPLHSFDIEGVFDIPYTLNNDPFSEAHSCKKRDLTCQTIGKTLILI